MTLQQERLALLEKMRTAHGRVGTYATRYRRNFHFRELHLIDRHFVKGMNEFIGREERNLPCVETLVNIRRRYKDILAALEPGKSSFEHYQVPANRAALERIAKFIEEVVELYEAIIEKNQQIAAASS